MPSSHPTERRAFAHSTFLGNDAAQGDHVAGGAAFLRVRNSILPGVSIVVDVCSGSVLSKGFNVANYDDPDCAFLDSDVFGPTENDRDHGLEPGEGPRAEAEMQGRQRRGPARLRASEGPPLRFGRPRAGRA